MVNMGYVISVIGMIFVIASVIGGISQTADVIILFSGLNFGFIIMLIGRLEVKIEESK